MEQQRTASQTQDLKFKACSQILVHKGLTNLTLSAFANEAGLTKGGMQYHFPTKESLIKALFEYYNNIFEQRLQSLAELEEGPGAWLRADAKASIDQISDSGNASLYASLFPAEERYASAHKIMRKKRAV